MGHPARMRVSDAERETVVAHLGQATSEGRLTLDEFSARSRRAYAARTRFELYIVIDDLPPPTPTGPTPTGPSAPAGSNTVAMMALVFGVLSLPLASCLPLGIFSGAIGVLLALITLGSGTPRPPRDRTVAMIGLTCGVLGVVLPLGLMMFFGLSFS